MSYLKFENEKLELLKSSKSIIVKDKINKKYYEINDLSQFQSVNWVSYKSKITHKKLYIYFTILFISLVINMVYFFFVDVDYNTSGLKFVLLSLFYTVPQVMLHEFAHIFCLSLFGKKIDKIGVKFNYIFPSIYVRMNDIYMLTSNEKIFVHSAGIMMNLVFNNIFLILSTIFHWNALLAISQFFVVGILMNVTPILNSDGYKVLLGILGLNEKKKKKNNNKLISILGYINIIISIVYSIKLAIGFLI